MMPPGTETNRHLGAPYQPCGPVRWFLCMVVAGASAFGLGCGSSPVLDARPLALALKKILGNATNRATFFELATPAQLASHDVIRRPDPSMGMISALRTSIATLIARECWLWRLSGIRPARL
jgi:hypothetical protein